MATVGGVSVCMCVHLYMAGKIPEQTNLPCSHGNTHGIMQINWIFQCCIKCYSWYKAWNIRLFIYQKSCILKAGICKREASWQRDFPEDYQAFRKEVVFFFKKM